jgi:cobaltochelatase CobN
VRRNLIIRADGKTVNVPRRQGHLFVCATGCCCGITERGYAAVPVDLYDREWERRKWRNRVHLTIGGCLGPCVLANVTMLIFDGRTLYFQSLNSEPLVLALLDYVDAMLAVLRRKLAREPGLQHVTTLLARWEDADVQPHDVVLAANALYRAADLRLTLSKLVRSARVRGIVVWSVGRDARRPASGYRPGPDYIHLLDGLFALDVFANVQIVERVAVISWTAQ